MSLAPYLAPDDREDRVEVLAEQAGGEIIVLGRSVQGRALRALRLPGDGDDLPRVLCTANIHGLEFIGAQVALSLAQAYLQGQGQAARLRRRAELWLIPCLNPDGYARTWEQGGRGGLAELRCNARGVDLNRNFPRPGGARASRLPGCGSSKPGRATYRGAQALCEPECAALESLLGQRAFVASANLHAFMGTVIPARVTDKPAYEAYRLLARAFAEAQPQSRYRRLASRHFDVFTGELEDHQHHAHQCWAVCIEHQSVFASFAQHLKAPSLFWRYNPRDPQRWVDNDVPGLLAYFLQALQLPRPERLR